MSLTVSNKSDKIPMKLSGQNVASQAFCLRWNNFQSNMLDVFERLLLDERFVDVTLACEGQLIKAHKMVLSASSSYFQEIFTTTPCSHPVIIMKDVPLKDLRKILEFMYKGEINVSKQEITSLLIVAEVLHVRGLAQIDTANSEGDDEGEPQPSTSSAKILAEMKNSKKSNRLKRTSARESSAESLVLIEDEPSLQPSKHAKMTTVNDTRIKSESPQDTPADELAHNSMHETEDEFLESAAEYDANDEFDTIAGDSVQIKQEEDIISNFSTNGNLQGFHWMDPSVHSLSSEPLDVDEVKPKPSKKNETSSKLKAPSWTADQLREAIDSVVRQKMRFTQASTKYNIPKGTLYDNILGKSNRMEVLAKSGLNAHDENTILEYCCDLSASPYNRRTRKPLSEILQFVYRLANCNHQVFDESGRFAYRWWWAFCKKYSIVSLHYDNNANIKMTERN